ncbi:hypothetical protein, partial [Burkholderia ubonensis]|uniref:hypothetical protein n=1 Tax=Burkholderia ubonensis TaxID=101571 RepID=UPI000B149BAB
SVSDSRRRVANDLFNRLTHKNADRFFFGDYSFPSAFARVTGFGRASSLYLTPAQFAQAHDEKQ